VIKSTLRSKTFATIFVATLCIVLCGAAFAQNVIQTENARPGTTNWQITSLSNNHEIEGYASRTSVNRGGSITFFVNSSDPTYTLQVYRMGWYGGLGGRDMGINVTLPRQAQPLPTIDATTGLIECAWSPSYTLTIPNDADHTVWPSGVYLVKLTGTATDLQRYMIFTVRDDARASDYFFQSSVNTYQAYNNWGGKSLYDFNSTGGRAYKVSFNRPYDEAYGNPDGAGQFKSGFEYNMLRFLERNGYDVTYGTDVDLQENSAILNNHKAFLSVGHDEYWSWNQRTTVTNARNAGKGLGFFSANTCYWQVRFEASAIDGAADRTMVGYKDAALTLDPIYLDGSRKNNYLTTTNWRSSPVNLPEAALIGVQSMDANDGGVSANFVVANASNPLFANTGLVNGSVLNGIVGYEVDRVVAGASPSNVQVLSHSPFLNAGDPTVYYADSTIYTASSGASVFGAGTMEIPWGVDNYLDLVNDIGLHADYMQPAAQQFTENVLARLIDVAPTPRISYTISSHTVNFNGSASSDPDGTIASYLWNFGDGTTSTAISPSHTFNSRRTFNVTLTVTDNLGAARTASVNIRLK
jgi:PKD repeat protein